MSSPVSESEMTKLAVSACLWAKGCHRYSARSDGRMFVCCVERRPNAVADFCSKHLL